MLSLIDILARHPTDKNTDHSYGPIYERILAPIRHSARVVVELGVFRGGSLRAWRDFFPQAVIHGIDIDPACLFQEERIICLEANQDRPAELARTLRQKVELGGVDLIVDDGQHDFHHQITCLFSLWDFLRPGGLYVIEDALEGIDRLALLPYGERFDLRGVKGRDDDVMFVFTKPA